jgi:hypothetical protein
MLTAKQELSMSDNGFVNLTKWCKQELARKEEMLSFLEAGKMRLSESRDGGVMVDVTDRQKETIRQDIMVLRELLQKHGTDNA